MRSAGCYRGPYDHRLLGGVQSQTFSKPLGIQNRQTRSCDRLFNKNVINDSNYSFKTPRLPVLTLSCSVLTQLKSFHVILIFPK